MPARVFEPLFRFVRLAWVRPLVLAAWLLVLLAPQGDAQSAQGLPAETLKQRTAEIYNANRLTPEAQRFFQRGGRVDPGILPPIRQSLAAVGIDPIGYCCHNDGSCDCVGLIDCAVMFTSATCNDNEPIICDDQGCSCSEAGPTVCPFDDCCY